MPYTISGFNIMLTELGTVALWASAHTADPGQTGTNEVSGGSYARQAITWNAAANANLDNNANPTLSIPAGTTVTHLGYWSAVTGGTLYAYDDIPPETFASAGSLLCSDVDFTLTN